MRIAGTNIASSGRAPVPVQPRKLIWLFTLAALLTLSACSKDDSPTGPGGGSAATSPDRIVVLGPQKVHIDNGEASYRAFALYADGRPEEDVTDRAVWSSDDESVFAVDGGTITILQGGLVHIRARLGDTEGKLNLSLVGRLTGLRLPEIEGAEHLPQIGQSTQLTATMSFPGQFGIDVTEDVLWESSDPSVLDVDIYGLATAVGNGEVYVTARYGNSPGTLNIVSGPMPDRTYDVTVIAIRIDADHFCEAADEGDAEFSYEFEITTSSGETFTLAATDDYPSSDDFVIMEDGPGSTGLLNVEGEVSFVLSEIQSFRLTARITEWDHRFGYFGEWIPDPEADDITETVTHRGVDEFDEGTHALFMADGGSSCDLFFEYRVVVTER